jgi:AraC-like DNA-binding protein
MSNRPSLWRATRYDAMTSVIDALRVRGHVYCRTEVSAPWGIAFAKSDLAHFHIIETGPCWLRLEGSRHGTRLASGDVALLLHGTGHVLSDAPRSRALPLEQWVGKEAASPGVSVLRGGGGGVEARFVCGTFSFERALRHPLVMQLPPLLHIRSGQGRSERWLPRTLRFLAEETRTTRLGTGTIVSRLTDIIFVQALRAWMDGRPTGEATWSAALRDRRIGAALDRMHESPGRHWTVASLAEEIGMSRSPFAERFKRLVGEAPLTYLTRWRMLTASAWLETSDVAIGEIAERTGYRSEAAFTKAFKRQFGLSPAVFRRRHARLSSAS